MRSFREGHWHGTDYETLLQEALQAARTLRDAGLQPGQPVLLPAIRSPHLCSHLLGILWAGGHYVCIDPRYPLERQSLIAVSTQASFGLCESGAEPLPHLPVEWLRVSWRKTPVEYCDPIADAELPAYVNFTSGSTGVPKAVVVPHRGVVRLVCNADYIDFSENPVFLQLSPLSFDASTLELWGPLLNGGVCVLHPENGTTTIEAIQRSIESQGVNSLWLTSSFYNTVISESPGTLRTVRQLLVGGESLSVFHIRRGLELLPETRIFNGYGPTENTTFTTVYPIPRPLPVDTKRIPIGYPIHGTTCDVFDDQLRPLADTSQPGELIAFGDGLALGYLGQPELTAERFIELPCRDGKTRRGYRTGDLVLLREDGCYDFLQRNDKQIKIDGHRIEPGEIELFLNSIPAISEARVLVRIGPEGQKRLAAFYVAKRPIDRAELRQHLTEHFPSYLVPHFLVPLTALPIDPHGKLDESKLPDPFAPATAGANGDLIAASWREVLSRSVPADERFFEAGGTSLEALRLTRLLEERFGVRLPPTFVFEYPTIASQARHFARGTNPTEAASTSTTGDIAIIGMAGRFPGARNLDEFWANLLAGKESIRFFSENELDPCIEPTERSEPLYVRAKGIIDDFDKFDASFFGVSPLEADVMDPQHRLLLELAWHALEDAGLMPGDQATRTGVFVGANWARYYQQHVLPNRDVLRRFGDLNSALANERDFLSTRISYRLNLKGPSVNVYTACSTGLVAVVQACAAIEQGQCEQAIAGGVSISVPVKNGYIYQESGMLSKDGHCRPFDAAATGTTFNDGAGLVVLKRRDLAERDGDRIYAVIKGYAINNDGEQKASFTAPSVGGQVDVYREALRRAEVDADSIGFVETHGTATPLGDPIEVQSLSRAFGWNGQTEKRCALGSVKSNIGHVIHAAGVAGLIKAALSVKYGQIPATLFFQSPNPALNLHETPFFVNTTTIDWPIPGVRRAAVNSLGVGGTNAQVIVEEHRPLAATVETADSIEPQTGAVSLLISAKTSDGLARQVDSYREFLKRPPDASVVDMAFTSALGRRHFPFRLAVSGRSVDDWLARLEKSHGRRAVEARDPAALRIGFLFSGQGSQRLDMGRWLYDHESLYRGIFARGAEIVREQEGLDLQKILFAPRSETSTAAMNETCVAQPALFLMEYALARLIQTWGCTPDFLIGHSIGEFAAACLAGVFEFEDAVRLVAKRGSLIQSMRPGTMMVVRTARERLEPLLYPPLCLAAINSPNMLTVSGPHETVAGLQETLNEKGIETSLLRTSHAFHSSMMDPVVEDFAAAVATVTRRSPKTPVFSTKTGNRLSPDEACSPAYWSAQLRQPVLFSAALQSAAATFGAENLAFIEVGPGNVLSTLTTSHESLGSSLIRASQPSSGITDASEQELNDCLGSLWVNGFAVDWRTRFSALRARKTRIPGYAFARDAHWLPLSSAAAGQKAALPACGIPSHPVSQNPKDGVMSQTPHLTRVRERLDALLEDVTGIDLTDVDPGAHFSEVGLNSLLLSQVAIAIDREFKVGITFRHLVEEYTCLGDLTEFVAGKTPDAGSETPAAASLGSGADAISVPALSIPLTPPAAMGNMVQDLINAQLQVMQMQLLAISGSMAGTVLPAASAATLGPTRTAGGEAAAAAKPGTETADTPKPPRTPRTRITREVLGAKITTAQKQWIDAVLAKYQKKFAGSKALTQKHRKCLADPRTVSGFNPEWKEVIFPIVTRKSKGSRLWDVDGNELIDVVNGFGPIFFGHSPDFLTEAIKQQLDQGVETGPQSPLAGEVAELFCELTGNDRCCFANTGSEAVAGAVRLARTVTGRPNVVMFDGDYHGIFDEVVVHPGRNHQALPAAPGINREATANMLILPWGEPESIETIRRLGPDLAAVLCEPVQSRKPEFHSAEYIRQLREVTAATGAALILDEVVTGFRVHPGGIRKRFDVDADLCTYGKVVGGGFPIGLIGGKARFMDALDGGYWQYGDNSIPEAGVTFFAGTFVRHPVALMAAKAVMQRIKSEGMALYDGLERKTADLAAEAKKFIADLKTGVTFEEFTSLFYLSVPATAHWGHLLFLMMTLEGIHIQQHRPSFLTTEHSPADVSKILGAFKSSLAHLVVQGLIEGDQLAAKKSLSGIGGRPPGSRLGKNAQGEPAYFVEDPDNKGKYIEVGRP